MVVALILVIIILAINLNYKNHCIEDLEASIGIAKQRKNEEFVEVLLRLKDFQDFEASAKDTCTRRVINEAIEKYASENRFETLISLGCKEYVKGKK